MLKGIWTQANLNDTKRSLLGIINVPQIGMLSVPVGSWFSIAPQYLEDNTDPPQVALDPGNKKKDLC